MFGYIFDAAPKTLSPILLRSGIGFEDTVEVSGHRPPSLNIPPDFNPRPNNPELDLNLGFTLLAPHIRIYPVCITIYTFAMMALTPVLYG